MPRLSLATLPILLASCVQPTLTKTNDPPVITIDEPGDGATYGQGETVSLVARVVDDGRVDDLLVDWLSNGTSIVADLEPDGDGLITFITADLALGPHAITARASDIDNLTAEDSVNIEVVEVDEDPRVIILRPESGNRGEEGIEFIFEAEVSDPNDLPEDLEVSISSDIGGDLCLEQADEDGFIVCRAVMQVPGDHRLTFTVTDPDGNTGSRNTILPVDPVPEDPVIQVVHPASGERPIVFTPYAFEATVSDRQDLASSLLVTLESSEDGYLCGMSVDANGTASCAAQLVTPGAHQLTFTVVDTDGNEGNAIVVTQASDGTDIDDDGDGLAENQGDCDDTNGSVYPGAPELPNGQDDNCNNIADEGTALYDDDSDGYCESQSFPCTDGSALGDCDDANLFVNPVAMEICGDGVDNNCNGQEDEIDAQGCTTFYFDGDLDGFGDATNTVCRCAAAGNHTALSGTDCDDTRANVNPLAAEIPDGIDNNCNGDIDEGTNRVDDDGDGFCESLGTSCSDGSIQGDCNDSDAGINPNALEVCGDNLDNNCNNQVDEAGAVGCTTFYADSDGDSFGDPGQSACLCAVNASYPVTNNLDCNDNSLLTSPNGTEAADGVDNDCDGVIDEGTTLFDDDGDGYCESQGAACSDGSAQGDCNDGVFGINPGVDEVCGDGIDNDCDGQLDEANAVGCSIFFADSDGDSFGDPDQSACLCAPDSTFSVTNDLDCNDNSLLTSPNGSEAPDGVDNDCDGTIDEGTSLFDDDGDGYCESPTGPCSDGTAIGDCDDSSVAIGPDVQEICGNGIDDNCNRQQNEAGAAGCQEVYTDDDGDGFGDPNDSACLCSPSAPYTVLNGNDCNDNDAQVGPGGGEIADGLDNDCDGIIDEGTALYDDDGDGYCESQGLACSDGSLQGDCDDGNIVVNPGADEVCGNGIDDNCSGQQDEPNAVGCFDVFADRDNDSFGNPNDSQCACGFRGVYDTTNGDDCDDNNVNNSPNGNEVPDGVDNNCNGTVDEGTVRFDDDGDGFCEGTQGICSDGSSPGDCNDASTAVNPGATEICNNSVDDDCNGSQNTIDAIGCTTYYRDNDGDGYGSPNQTVCACSAQGNFTTDNTDCDDSQSTVNPSATERPDGLDNNCNGQFDEGTNRVDNDGDGFCGAATCTAQPGQSAPSPGDCNDGDASVNPAATEICANGVDDNCNSQQNEGQNAIGSSTFYADNDNDGYGSNTGRQYCQATGIYRSTTTGDCDDSNPSARPGQTAWFTGARTNGTWDYNCDGVSTRRWTGEYDCECTVSIFGIPAIIVDFDDGWANEPSCGGSGTWYNSCSYQSAQIDIFGICNPLGPEVASTVGRTQQCR